MIMPNTREKLIKLLNESSGKIKELCGGLNDHNGNGVRADHLIAHGVTVQDNTEVTDELLEQLRKAPVMVMTEEPTVEFVQEWISVKDRLPEKSGKYIVCSRKNEWEEPNVYQAKFYRYVSMDGGHWGQKDKGKNITHWMPLPEPPKGE